MDLITFYAIRFLFPSKSGLLHPNSAFVVILGPRWRIVDRSNRVLGLRESVDQTISNLTSHWTTTMTLNLKAMMICLITAPSAALAEVELSFYGGAQSAPHSTVDISGDDVIPTDDFFVGWEGRSFDAPPYYGIRATIWNSPTFGYGLDFTHNKIYPQDGDLPEGFDRLEFTDGLNTLTVNAYRRWQNQWGSLTPYVGGGLGVSIPHVEVEFEGAEETRGYQLTGPAATWIAGASYPIADDWSVFGEYKGTYTVNSADLDSGGTLETDVITNAVNVGVSFRF